MTPRFSLLWSFLTHACAEILTLAQTPLRELLKKYVPNSTALAFQKPRHVFQDDMFSKRMFLQDELLRYSVVLWGDGGGGGGVMTFVVDCKQTRHVFQEDVLTG